MSGFRAGQIFVDKKGQEIEIVFVSLGMLCIKGNGKVGLCYTEDFKELVMANKIIPKHLTVRKTEDILQEWI